MVEGEGWVLVVGDEGEGYLLLGILKQADIKGRLRIRIYSLGRDAVAGPVLQHSWLCQNGELVRHFEDKSRQGLVIVSRNSRDRADVPSQR